MGNWAVLIPARAGSKSIKNKNLMPINGAPLVMHSIETACNLKNIQQVYVSTDSKDISKICSSTGVTVLERPDHISGDTARDEGYLYHFKDYIESNSNELEPIDYILLLRPTCPFRHIPDILEAMDIFENSSFSSMRSIAIAKQSPFKMWYATEGLNKELTPVLAHPLVRQSFNAPRQILPEVYWQDGYLECIRYSCLKDEIYPGAVMGWLNVNDVCDIDHNEDIPIDSIPHEELNSHIGLDSRRYSS